jgi:hypothetical protein
MCANTQIRDQAAGIENVEFDPQREDSGISEKFFDIKTDLAALRWSHSRGCCRRHPNNSKGNSSEIKIKQILFGNVSW